MKIYVIFLISLLFTTPLYASCIVGCTDEDRAYEELSKAIEWVGMMPNEQTLNDLQTAKKKYDEAREKAKFERETEKRAAIFQEATR